MRGWAGLLAIGCVGLLTACTPSIPARDDTTLLLARALQLAAPAMMASGDGAALVWTGFDSQDVHLDGRRWDDGQLQPPVILPLPPTHPLDTQLSPAADGALHLFWRDAATNGGGNRLYSALLRPDLSIERGPVEISGATTYQYAALADDEGGAWLAWSEGHPAEPRLMLGRVDSRGLPEVPVPAGVNGQFPAFAVWPDGRPVLVWEQAGQLWRGRASNTGLIEMTALTATVGRRAGDHMEVLWAARCGTELCVGWNLVRANGTAESWLASGSVDGPYWEKPRRVEELRWLTPETSPSAEQQSLRAAAQTDGGLNVVSIRDGQIVTVQLVAPGVALEGVPGLLETASSGLLAWAEPGPDYANLVMQPVTLPGNE